MDMQMPDIWELHYVPLWEATLRILLATGLAVAVGYERQYKEKPLDLRPFTLISVGSCLAVLAIMETAYSAADAQLAIDPARVIGGILGGIGFLGAGALFRSSGEVHGGATAAAIWIMGAIGVSCALGAYALAILVAIIALVTLLMGGYMRNQAGQRYDSEKNGGES